MATNLPIREVCLNNLISVNIANLPDSSATGNPTCQICLGDLDDNATPGESERAVTLHDSHYFGEDCIRHWLEQNDSCPLCRNKVHKGSPHDNRLAIDLLTAMAQMIRQDPSIESPIDDRALLSLFGQMRRAAETIASDSVRGLLEDASCRLLRWRRDWWLKNPAFLQMGEFASHTSSNALRAEAHDTTIVVRAEQSCLLVLQQVNDGYDQAIENVYLGQPAHVATHPLSFVVSRVLRKQLTANDRKRMSVKELGFRLHNAVKQDQYLQDLAVALGKERPEALRFLTAWMDDVLIHVLQDLIWSSSQ